MAAEVLIQLERLLIPFAFDVGELARFAVAAAVAIAPFSTLEKAANATLIPRLQQALGRDARRRLARVETALLTATALLGGGLIVWLGPFVIDIFAGPDVQIGRGLLLAVSISGASRMIAAVSRSAAAAFCTTAELRRFSRAAWLATALAAAIGIALARFGLVGLVCGVATGWIMRGVFALHLAWPHLTEGDREAGRVTTSGRPGESGCESG
jgi:hypothetical protein